IRRVTAALDPLGYAVNTVAAPNLVEKQFHYLWRFWHNVPPNGEIAIFDRTWYGRVLVERVEGFAKPEEWRRAYQEINETEAQWAKQGIIIFKFWMQISKEEQYARFKARENDPDKIWKITEEDWRNREKWAAYEEAVNEMLFRTDTKYAPWTVVEANSKYYSRLKVLKTMVDRLEEILK
ncbi:MAG: phosphate--AMP phosphotransferase, partial [Acidaminococcaceae bacterium]